MMLKSNEDGHKIENKILLIFDNFSFLFFSFLENRLWYFMQIVSSGYLWYSMQIVSWEKLEKCFKMLSTEIFTQSAKR